MRVLHVDTALEWRGGQQQLAYLLAARPQDGWAGVADGPLAQRIGPPALSLYPGGDPRNLWCLRRPDWDLVAAHTPHAHAVALACGRPLVVHRRTDFVPKTPWKYRIPQAVICVSERIREVMLACGVAPERLHVVHSGVSSRAGGRPILDLPRPIWGAIGALVPHKGHSVLVDAMRTLPGTAVIVGEGPERPALLRQVREAGLQERVLLLGHREDVADLLASFDVLVHPSREEGLGQVLAEALSAGCPVVASRAGGIPEVVGEEGVLVVPGDPVALAAGMQEGLKRERRVIERFSVASMVGGTERVYAGVLAAHRLNTIKV